MLKIKIYTKNTRHHRQIDDKDLSVKFGFDLYA